MHYLVAVMTREEPDEALLSDVLAPYDENITVPRYVSSTKEEIIQRAKENRERYAETYYAEYLKDPEGYTKRNGNPGHIKYVSEEFPEILKMNDEELYQNEIKRFPKLSDIAETDGSDAVDENGCMTSTYNPKSKWDWWVVGGRWSGELPIKRKQYGANSASVKDIRFGHDTSVKQYIATHPEVVEEYEDLCKNGGEWYKAEYYRLRYPTLEDYVIDQKEWCPYSFIDINGEWHEPGRMGWFNSMADEADIAKWHREFYDTFIKGHEDCYITIVDCHI